MGLLADFRQLLKPYYWVNIFMSLSYVSFKRVPEICHYLHPDTDCDLDSRETEILFFLVIVVMLRTRKAGSVTMVNYLSSSFVYTKIANLILWFYADVRYGLVYGAIFILFSLLLPEPAYSGPEHVVYFRGVQSFEEEVRRSPDTTWILCLYAAWHPACVNFAPVFAELSSSYHLDNLKFGKLDIGRYPESAQKFYVDDGPGSRQLPTVMVMKAGKEVARRPQHDAHTRKLQKFLFSKENVSTAFNLDNLYKECKDKLASSKDDKKTI